MNHDSINLVVTATTSVTAVGLDGAATAESVFTGESGIAYDETREDDKGKPVKTAVIEGLERPRFEGDEAGFMDRVSEHALTNLCEGYFTEGPRAPVVNLLIGLSSRQRPGLRLDGDEAWAFRLEGMLLPFADRVRCAFYPCGNASGIHGVKAAAQMLHQDPEAMVIVGAVDSLLSPFTLDWFEKDRRLVSESLGRNHGLFPSHAAGFFILESEKGAAGRRKRSLARITGHSLAMEPFPYVSDGPCNGDGLTRAVRQALKSGLTEPPDIEAVFCDLNGERHRARTWAFADIRCFPYHTPRLVHPADCMGDVGAAWVPVLTGLIVSAFERGEIEKKGMVLCSDDHGECGAMILENPAC